MSDVINKRLGADPPTPEQLEAEEKKWWSLLPKPPLHEVRDDMIEHWMRMCVKAAGDDAMEALQWLWNDANFPFASERRARLFHVYGQLARDIDEANRARREVEAKRRVEEFRDQRYEARKKAGWA